MALYAFDGTNDDDSKAATNAAGVAADTDVFRFVLSGGNTRR